MTKKPFKKDEPKIDELSKFRAHTRYKNREGVTLPSVTTVLGILNKPALIVWANRLGLQGIDSTKYRDEMGVIGGLAHALISSDLKGEKLLLSGYSQDQIDKANNCMKSYFKWREKKNLNPYVIETPLVSEEFQFGGTTDFYGTIDGENTILDYKTGGVYKEAYIQTCAYRQLLIENGHPLPSKITILGIPRTDDEKFQEITYTDFTTGWETFKHLLLAYNYLKEMK